MIRISAITFLITCLYSHSFTFAQVPSAPAQVVGAGTILLTPTRDKNGSLEKDRDGKIQYSILIADHTNDRGHGPLGGTVEEGEEARDTAARETAEESRHVLKETKIRKLVGDAPEVLIGRIALYVIVIDYVDPSDMDKAAVNCEGCGERVGYAWIPVSVVDQIIASADKKIPKQYRSSHAKTDSFWNLFALGYPLVRPQIGKQIEADRNRRGAGR